MSSLFTFATRRESLTFSAGVAFDPPPEGFSRLLIHARTAFNDFMLDSRTTFHPDQLYSQLFVLGVRF